MFRRRRHDVNIAQLAAFFAFACLMTSVAFGQEARPINLGFKFPDRIIDNRFEQTRKAEVEKELAARLASICQKEIPYWTFRSTGDGLPRLEVRLLLKNSTWLLAIGLIHLPGRLDLKDTWSSVLFEPGYLATQVLPKDKGWISAIATSFEGWLQGESKYQLVKALEEFAPLGTQMATVSQGGTAVLPLRYKKYSVLSMSTFRIICEWRGHGIVTLYSTGLGDPYDFTPDAPQFKGIWIRHNKWMLGGDTEDIAKHITDLPGLQPRWFYLEQLRSASPLSAVPE